MCSVSLAEFFYAPFFEWELFQLSRVRQKVLVLSLVSLCQENEVDPEDLDEVLKTARVNEKFCEDVVRIVNKNI